MTMQCTHLKPATHSISRPTASSLSCLVLPEVHSRRAALVYIAAAPLLTGTLLTNTAQAAFVDEETAIAVFQKVAPSVVTVEDYSVVQGRETSDGVGSGFVWSKYGHVVTNYHCISRVIRDQTRKSVCYFHTGNMRLALDR